MRHHSLTCQASTPTHVHLYQKASSGNSSEMQVLARSGMNRLSLNITYSKKGGNFEIATLFLRNAGCNKPQAKRVCLRALPVANKLVDEESREIVSADSISQEVENRQKRLIRKQQRLRERAVYQAAAIAASTGVTALAIFATYYRISWHLAHGEAFPYEELGATLLLVLGGMVGMEMYARWAHKYLWHENKLGWTLHKSHHEPRTGPFEANDIYAVMNAAPAIFLCGYGFLRPDVIGGLCFGTGLGITLFGISYMFVHDGLVHKRFPVGPIANLPVLKKVAVAHQMHHSEKYGGVPFGMFLGPEELKDAGFQEDFEQLLAASMAASERKEKK